MSADRGSTPTGAKATMVTVDGNEFRVVDVGRGPAVLFCHGFPDTAETWRRQMDAVASAGFRAVAPDMRGFGASYAPPGVDQYTSLRVVGDLVGLLDVLDIATAVLVGHDWGADYAQRAMVMRPDRFTALVSLSIPFAPRGVRSLRDDLFARGLGERYYAFHLARAGGEHDFPPAAEAIPRILYWLSASPPPDQRWDPIDPRKHMLRPSPAQLPEWVDRRYLAHPVRAFERTGFRTGLNYYRALQPSFDLTAAFTGALITAPSLYIWGTADGLCQFFHPDGLSVSDLRRVHPGLVDQVAVEDAGHWVHLEAPAQVNHALLSFLTSTGALR